MISRLLNRCSSMPVTGNVSISPSGRANNTDPSSASLKFSFCCMAGILEAQVENPKPETKKNNVMAMRALAGEFIFKL